LKKRHDNFDLNKLEEKYINAEENEDEDDEIMED
jgi:hypothetical protein